MDRTIHTTWYTANDLLASVNQYRERNPQVAIGSEDHLLVEPTLVWIAYEHGVKYKTWSIPLRLFRSTVPYVREEFYQGQDDRLNIERRILALMGGFEVTKQEKPIDILTTLDVVGYHEERNVVDVRAPGSNQIKYIAPVSGTAKFYLDVRIPEGPIYRIPVDESILEAVLASKGLERCRKSTSR